MEIIQSNALMVLNILIFLSIFTTFIILSRLKKQISRHSKILQHVEHELKVLSGGAIGVGQRIIDIESKFRRLMQRQEELENVDPERSNYEQAAKLVEKGATTLEVANTCKISQAEAELVVALVQLNKAKENVNKSVANFE